MGAGEVVCAEIRSKSRPANWNCAQLSEELEVSLDVDGEFESAITKYFAKKEADDITFSQIRAQYRPAAWNQAELSEEIDLSIDVDGEFQSAVSEYFAQIATFANIRASTLR